MSAWDWAREDEAARHEAYVTRKREPIAEARADGMRTARSDALTDVGVASPDLAREWASAYVYGEPGGDAPETVPAYAGDIVAAWYGGYRDGARW